VGVAAYYSLYIQLVITRKANIVYSDGFVVNAAVS